MAQNRSTSSDATSGRRDGDWLLSYNRKVRNLTGISLRNLSLVSAAPSRRRRKTIDDDALPHTLQSPAKLVTLRESKTLNHSRSSSDLRALAKNAAVEGDHGESVHGTNGSAHAGERKSSSHAIQSKRPAFTRMRRSTLEWTNASLQARQEKLEGVADEHMADVFFTLHVQDVQEPVYVSETVRRTMNPSFRQIDWTVCGPGVMRGDQLFVKVWVHSGTSDHWRQLLDVKVHFKRLQFLSKSLDALESPLPQNAVLFHMVDGIYLAPTDSFSGLAPFIPSSFPGSGSLSTAKPLPTSSFDALLRLAKLDDSIQDALATRERIANDLEKLLQTNEDALKDRDLVSEQRDRLETIDYAKKTVERQLDKARKQHAEKRESIATRQKLMQSDSTSRKIDMKQMSEGRSEFSTLRTEHDIKTKATRSQRRRICEELQACFPIQPRPGKALQFSIRGLHLPNSEDLDAEPTDTVSAALGLVAQTLQLISFYHAYPLPYPVQPRGSSSTVLDPISILKSNTPITSSAAEQNLRTYPLFSKGVPRFRFEYGVFLLNEDIRILLEGIFKVRVVDVRQTLPNLKYLLYVATAGEGELPARKAGGVRGLLRAPLRRVGSSDSTSSTVSATHPQSNGKPADAVQSLKRLGGRW